MDPIHLSGLLVQPLAQRIRGWCSDGKLTDDDLDRRLTADARAHLEHSTRFADWASIADVESLVALAAEQIGGETGLVDWAEEIVDDWQAERDIDALLRSARSLTDGPGYVVSQVAALLVRDADWVYEGGRSAFSVRLRGLTDASPGLKSLVGALLARMAMCAKSSEFDVRFEGVDEADLVVFGETTSVEDTSGESRLHQAALIA